MIAFLRPSRRTELASRKLSKITGPSPEPVRNVILNVPNGTFTERRNRALLTLIFLTGVRNASLVSLRLTHIDLVLGCIHQNGGEVSTKFGKNMRTIFFPVGKEIREIVMS